MSRRRLSHWLAPLALIGAVAAILVVINNSDVGGKGSSGTGATVTGASEQSKKVGKKHHHGRTYIVRSGDTLSAISVRTGVSLHTIEKLNPDLDAQSLHAGEKVKLSGS